MFKRKKGKCLKASFTVEASFVVPVIVLGIIALIWVVFYLRNSVKAVADADYFVFVLESDEAYSKDAARYEERSSEAKKSFYGAKEARVVIAREGRDIDVELEVEHRLPEEGLMGALVSRLKTISVKREEKCPDPSETARLIKAAGEIIGNIKELVRTSK